MRLLLVHKANVDAWSVKGETAFLLSCVCGNVDCMEALVHAGCEIDARIGECGITTGR